MENDYSENKEIRNVNLHYYGEGSNESIKTDENSVFRNIASDDIKIDEVQDRLNITPSHTTPKALSETLKEIMFEITEKITAGNYDAQSLPILDELLDEISALSECESRREEIITKRLLIQKQARLQAIDAVNSERKNREDNIRKQHEENDFSIIEEEKERIREKVIFRKNRSKRQMRMFEEEQAMKEALQKKINEDKILKREEQLSRDKFNRAKKSRLENLKNAHDEKQFRLNLMQEEKHLQQKRAHKQKEIDFKNAADVKKWQDEQEQLEKTMESESKAMEAKYAADIAESERRLAEELQAAQIAKEDAYNEEMHAIRYKQAIENAKNAGKEKAKIDSEIEMPKNDNNDKVSVLGKLFNRSNEASIDNVNAKSNDDQEILDYMLLFNNFDYESEKDKWDNADSINETVNLLNNIIESVNNNFSDEDKTDSVLERIKELKKYRRLAKTAYTKHKNKDKTDNDKDDA